MIPQDLSKREYFAAAALKGFLAQKGFEHGKVVIQKSVEYADELIAHLEATKHRPHQGTSVPPPPHQA